MNQKDSWFGQLVIAIILVQMASLCAATIIEFGRVERLRLRRTHCRLNLRDRLVALIIIGLIFFSLNTVERMEASLVASKKNFPRLQGYYPTEYGDSAILVCVPATPLQEYEKSVIGVRGAC